MSVRLDDSLIMHLCRRHRCGHAGALRAAHDQPAGLRHQYRRPGAAAAAVRRCRRAPQEGPAHQPRVGVCCSRAVIYTQMQVQSVVTQDISI